MTVTTLLRKIKESEDIKELRKIALKIYKDLMRVESELIYSERYRKEGHELAKKYRDDGELNKKISERVISESIESGQRLIVTIRNETLLEAAKIAEDFFEDDKIEGIQIAKAIKDVIPIKPDPVADESFQIKTMNDVVQRMNEHLRRNRL